MEKRTEFLCNRISSCVNDHGLGRNQRNLRSSRFIRVRGSGMSGLPARELTSLNFIFATDLWSYWIGYSQRRSAACFSQQFPSLLRICTDIFYKTFLVSPYFVRNNSTFRSRSCIFSFNGRILFFSPLQYLPVRYFK